RGRSVRDDLLVRARTGALHAGHRSREGVGRSARGCARGRRGVVTVAGQPSGEDLADEALRRVAPRPIRAHHAFESCVEQLATAVRLGIYAKGSMLPPERELAAAMEVSRASLREAIAALREAGLLQTVRGRGGGTMVLAQPE